MTIILRCPQETKPGYLPCVSAVTSLWKSKQEAGCKYITCSSPFSCPKKCKQEYSWNCLAWGPATSCLNFDNTDSSNPRTWYISPSVCIIFDFLHQIFSHTGMPCWDIVFSSKRCHCPARPQPPPESAHTRWSSHAQHSQWPKHPEPLYSLLTLPSRPPPSTKAVILSPPMSLFCAFLVLLICWNFSVDLLDSHNTLIWG